MALRLLSTKAISAIAKPQYFCRGLTTFGSLRTTCFRSNKTIPIRNFSKTPFLKNDSVLKTKTDPFTPHGDEASGVRNDFAYLFGGVSLVGGGCTYLYASRSKSNLDSEGAYTTDDFTQKVQKTYAYILGGIGITATSAFCFFKTKLPYKFLSMNPWAFLGTSLVIGIPTLIAAISIDYHENPVAKHIAWASFNVAEGACLCTLGFFGAPVIAQAALATVALVGGLSFVGMSINRKNPDNLAKYETPLGVGLGVIVAAGLGAMFYPVPLLQGIMLYGGLAVFGGLTMTDTNKMLEAAKKKSVQTYDPITEGMGIYLDALNIFIRLVQIIGGNSSSKKQ